MDLGDLLNEKEWRKCRVADDASVDDALAAFEYFCSTYWHIRHPERGRIKFVLREAQLETARNWMEHRYTIVLKARQIGFSTLAAAFVFWETFFWSDRFADTLARYAHRLRGFTVYPDGARGGQPLTAVPYSEAKEKLGEIFEESVATHDICDITGKGGSCGI